MRTTTIPFILVCACASKDGERGATPSATPTTTASAPAPTAAAAPATPAASPLAYTVNALDGKPTDLATYKGKVVLIVNTASECGFTPQYADLEKLYETYKDRGLVVLGFPSNDFGQQEPGSSEEIASFCKKNYGVTFPMMEKVETKGANASPVYKTLTDATPENIRGPVKWNFTKFLIDRSGTVVARFEPKVTPMAAELTSAIEQNLSK